MIMLLFAIGLVLCPFISTKVEAQIADECKCSNDIYDYIWMSIPPVEDTSITVYYCAFRHIFYYPCCGDRLVIRAGIKPAEASDSEWEYFNVLDVICDVSIDCSYLGYRNFSNYLIDGHVFNGLSKNETYTLKSELYFDYPSRKYFEEMRNITTLTKGPVLSSTQNSILVTYATEAYYYTYAQPVPRGHNTSLWRTSHESILEKQTSNDNFPSVTNTTFYGLQPNTEYIIHTHANGSCYEWMQRVKTLPIVPSITDIATTPRDNSVILHLIPSTTNELIETCEIQLVNEIGEMLYTRTDVVNNSIVYITGLTSATNYTVTYLTVSNSEGESVFPKSHAFQTSQKVLLTTDSGIITMKWSAPNLNTNFDLITSYHISISTKGLRLKDQTVLTYTLPPVNQHHIIAGLESDTYIVELKFTTQMLPYLQPFYASSIYLTTPDSKSNSSAILDGLTGGGIMFAIFLVITVVIVVAFGSYRIRKRRSRKETNGNQPDVNMQDNPSYATVMMSEVKDKQEEVTDEPRYFIENEAKVYEDVTVEPDDTRKKELKTTAPTYANVDRSV